MAMRMVCRALLLWLVLGVPAWGVAVQQEQTRTVEGLVFDLQHPDPERRKQAAAALGQNKVRTAVPALIEATRDSDASVRYEAVKALVQIHDNRALESYIRLTRDSEKRTQEKAIEGIINTYVADETGLIQGVKKVVGFLNPFSDDYNPLMVEPYVPVSQDAVNALIDLLFHNDRGLRKDAATALGILRARSALPAIEDALQQERSNDVKVELIRAVYKIGDPSAGEMLVPFIRDRDKKVHDEAIFAVGRLRVKSAVPQLNEIYRAGIEERRRILGIVPVSGSDDLQRKVIEALSYIGDSSSTDIFLDALEDERTHYRRHAAEGLGRSGQQEHVTLLARKYLREDSGTVKLALGFALFKLGREEHLVELVDSVQNDQAYYYLLELNSDQARLLYPHLRSERDSVKIRLLDVIGLTADMSAMPVVQELSQSKNTDVVSAANLAIRRLNGRFPDA